MRSTSEYKSIKHNLPEIEPLLLAEVCENGEFDLNQFCNLVDLYVYLPQKKDGFNPGHLSPNMFLVMSSNVNSKATVEKDKKGVEDN